MTIDIDDESAWRIGRRVCRKDSDDLGTIVASNGNIKVKWDDGATSYFKRGKPGNVQLKLAVST